MESAITTVLVNLVTYNSNTVNPNVLAEEFKTSYNARYENCDENDPNNENRIMITEIIPKTTAINNGMFHDNSFDKIASVTDNELILYSAKYIEDLFCTHFLSARKFQSTYYDNFLL